MKYTLTLAFTAISYLCISQSNYKVSHISEEIRKNASAIVRDQSTDITLHDFDDITIRYSEVITIFDKNGLKVINPAVHYDESTSVKKVEALVYDREGEEVEKYKKKDFLDVSASGGSLYSDDRMKVLDFTPSFYPFTMKFSYEIHSSSTAFIKPWYPSRYSNVSVEKSKYVLHNPKKNPLTPRKFNVERENIRIAENTELYTYEATNLLASRHEVWGPSVTEFLPMVKFAPQKFQLNKIPAEVSNWKEFGNWQHEKLLKGRDVLSQSTKDQITALVSNIEEPKEKAKAIYEFMQNKTRYVSVQVGIGGWQPSTAEEVDRLGYGDCKGLTNYTMALLKSQGIKSYYTIVDSQPDGKDLDEDFVAMQGDHVMLSVPFEDETVFLECTDQRIPFNFLGRHTDNRKVLMVTPEGGVMTRTHTYTAKDNVARLTASVKLDDSFKLKGGLERNSFGLQYAGLYGIESQPMDDITNYYKRSWGHHNNMNVSNIDLKNDKDLVKFTENLDFETEGYVSKAADRILFAPNLFTRIDYVPKKSSGRTLPLVVRREYSYVDEIKLEFPDGYVVDSMLEPFQLETEFGAYKISMTPLAENTYLYKREFSSKSGSFPKERYNDYVNFIKTVVKKDKAKIILSKI